MSLFYGFVLGGQALVSNRRAIDITNQNISNVFTEGYSRKIPVFTDIPTGGVNLEKVQRSYDEVLFRKLINSNQMLVSDESYKDLLTQVESIFNDIQGSGFSNALNEFFNAFHAVSLNPNDMPARYDAITKAKQLVGRIRNSYDNLKKTLDYISLSLEDQIKKLNSLTDELSKINENIKFATGNKKLQYLDERNRVLKEISSLIDTKVIIKEDETVDVFTSKGFTLVSYNKSYKLEKDSSPELSIRWEGIDITDQLKNGKIGGFVRGYRFTEKVINNLNDFTSLLALMVNKVHSQGYDLYGNTGINFFGIDPSSSSSIIDASNIVVAIDDPKNLAAALDPTLTNSDNRNIKKIIELKDSVAGVLTSSEETDLLSDGSITIGGITYTINSSSSYSLLKERNFGELYNTGFTTTIGFELESVKKSESTNRYLYESFDQQLKEKTAVNMDEELINLTKLQRVYEASARIINVTDELIETVLNLVK